MAGVRPSTQQSWGSQEGGAEKRVHRGGVTQVPLQQVESRMSQVPHTVGTHHWAEGHLKG